MTLETAVVEAFRVLGTEALVPQLVALVTDTSSGMRTSELAVVALAAVDSPEAVRALIDLLGDNWCRHLAAARLMAMGEAAVPYLEQAETHDSKAVRKTAEKLLKSIQKKLDR